MSEDFGDFGDEQMLGSCLDDYNEWETNQVFLDECAEREQAREDYERAQAEAEGHEEN